MPNIVYPEKLEAWMWKEIETGEMYAQVLSMYIPLIQDNYYVDDIVRTKDGWLVKLKRTIDSYMNEK